MDITSLIPAAHHGKNTALSTSVKCNDLAEAQSLFRLASQRLLDPDGWQDLAGKAGAAFRLFNNKGEEVGGPARVGHLIRIDIPGPGAKSGDGYDWVRVQSVREEDSEVHDQSYILLTLTPSPNPQNSNDEIAHFLEAGSTSSFVIQQDGTIIKADYFGRNEKINTAVSGLDKIRNSLIGLGAFAGFSELQWKSLLNGFVNLKSAVLPDHT